MMDVSTGKGRDNEIAATLQAVYMRAEGKEEVGDRLRFEEEVGVCITSITTLGSSRVNRLSASSSYRIPPVLPETSIRPLWGMITFSRGVTIKSRV